MAGPTYTDGSKAPNDQQLVVVAGVDNTGTTQALLLGTDGALSVSTGASTGAAASGAAKSGNPVQTGGVYNSTQPTVTTGQVVETQASARGATIVATGVDILAAQVSGPAASGAAKSGNPVQVGAVFNTTQPTVTNGQAVENQATARGAQIVATGVDAFAVSGPAASGASKSGNPVQIGAVFNTTQPTVTTGQLVEAQATARGARIVATGVDAFAISGDVAQAAANSGNPVQIGVEGRSTDITAVTTGQRTKLVSDLVGKQVVLPYALPGLTWIADNNTTGATDVTLKAAPGAGLCLHVTSLHVSNNNAATVGFMDVRDGTAGGYIARCVIPANTTIVFNFPTPARLTANTLLNMKAAGAVTTLYVTAQGFTAP